MNVPAHVIAAQNAAAAHQQGQQATPQIPASAVAAAQVGNSTPGELSPQLKQLEANVAAAISNEPVKDISATGGEILPNHGSEQEHDQNIFNKGQELAVQMEHQRMAYEQQLQANNQQMGAMQHQLKTVTDQLAQVTNNIPTQREISPAEKYALSPEEIAEMETTMGGVQKLANAAAETEAQKTIQYLTAQLEERDTKFNQAIEQLKAQQTLQGEMTKSTYDTTIYNTGLSLGIDVTALPKDQNFQQFLNQQESPYSDRNLHAVIQQAEKTGDVKTTAKILKAYSDSVQQQQGLTGAPTSSMSGMPAGGGAMGGGMPQHLQQQQQEESPLVRLNNQRAELQNMRVSLNEKMSLRSIDPEVFRAEMQKIDQLDNQLIDTMRQAT